MNLRKIIMVTVVTLVLGLAIILWTQLFGYDFTSNQWDPWWAFYVFQIGIALFCIGFVLVIYATGLVAPEQEQEQAAGHD